MRLVRAVGRALPRPCKAAFASLLRLYAQRVRRRYGDEHSCYADRELLELSILPRILAFEAPGAILEVGREDWQSYYNRLFFGREHWTVDIDPAKRCWGASKHLVTDICDIRQHFVEGYFDLVIFNGVVGWGLDHADDVERAFSAIFSVLRPGGLVIFGYNDLPARTPVGLDQVAALERFDPWSFAPLGAAKFCVPGELRHTYRFLRRPMDDYDGEQCQG